MRARHAVVLVAVVLTLSPASADEPSIHSVEPASGFSDEETVLHVNGEQFDSDARVSLVAGTGPRILSTLSGVQATDVEILGDFALALAWDSLASVDLSNPAAPRVVSALPTAVRSTRAIAVAGSVACVLGSTDQPWMQTFDVSSPDSPVLLGSLDLPGELPRWNETAAILDVDGRFAYVAAGSAGLLVVDIGDPASPGVVGSIDSLGVVRRVAVENDIALVVAGEHTLHVVDVAIPEEPRQLGTLDTPLDIRSLDAADGRVYLAGFISYPEFYGTGLQILDLGNAGTPSILGTVPLPGLWGADVAVSDGLAYVAAINIDDHLGALHVIDVRDPLSAALIGSVETPGPHSTSIALGDGIACLGTPSSGLPVVGIRDAEWSEVAGSLVKFGWRLGVAVEKGIAYLLDGSPDSGVKIVDVRNPEAPQELGSVDSLGWAKDAAVSGGFAFVLWGEGMAIVDAREPTNAQIVGRYELPGRGSSIAIRDSLIYVVGRTRKGSAGWMEVLSVLEPASPSRLGSVALSDDARDLAVDGTRAYVIVDGDIDEIEVEDPERPTPVRRIETPGSAFALDASGGYVYVTEQRGRFHVIEVDDPGSPEIIGSLGLSSKGRDLVVSQGVAYLATGYEGLQVVDVRDPHSPALVAQFDVLGSISSVAISDEFVLVAASLGEGWVSPVWGHLSLIRPWRNPRVEDLNVQSPTSIVASAPSGLAVGPYSLRVAHPDTEWDELDGAFRVCERRALALSLDPRGVPDPPEIALEATKWRAELAGDAQLFSPKPLHEAGLLLPQLPAQKEIIPVPAADPDRAAIELHIAPSLGLAEVRLIARDSGALESKWASIEEAGGIALPIIDDYNYGDIELTLQRRPPARDRVSDPSGGLAGKAAIVYRYEFAEGELTAARAWGPDVDHVFTAKATYDWTCEVEDTVSYNETRRELCEELQAEHPELVLYCDF